MSDRDAAPAGLDREATRQTVLWGIGLSALTKFAGIGLSIVLARLIAPELFGQYGTVSASLLLIMSFSMQPFANHLFHQRDPTPEDFHRHLAFGTVLHVALFLIANLVAFGMRFSPTLSVVAIYVHVGSLAILINIPRIYYWTYLRLQLRWKTMRLLGFISLGAYASASIILALMGHGVYALLAQNLVVPLPYVVAMLFDAKGLRGFNFDWRAYQGAFRFGLARTGSGALYQGQVALESYALTLLVGFGPLGVFLRARGLAQLATTWLTEQVNAILYPSMAKLEPRSAPARRTAGLLMRLGFWTTAPVVISGSVAGEQAIHLLYGPQWTGAVPFLAPLLIAALAISQVGIARLVVLTNDGARRTLVLDIASAAINLVGLAVLLVADLQAYAVYLAVANVAFLGAVMAVMVRTELIVLDDLLRTFAPGVLVGAAAFAVSEVGGASLMKRLPGPVTLAVVGAATTLLMGLFVRVLDRAGLDTLCGLLPHGARLRRWLGLARVKQ